MAQVCSKEGVAWAEMEGIAGGNVHERDSRGRSLQTRMQWWGGGCTRFQALVSRWPNPHSGK